MQEEEDDDDYSDYEDDFESDDEEPSTLGSTGGSRIGQNIKAINQQQELDRVVQTYQEILEATASAEVVSGFS